MKKSTVATPDSLWLRGGFPGSFLAATDENSLELHERFIRADLERDAPMIKRSLAAKPQRGFDNAVEDIQPAKAFVVHAGEIRYPISESVEAIGLREMVGLFSGATTEGR